MSPRPPETDPLAVEDLRFAVRRSARRRTVGITVRRDGALVAAAPLGMSTPALKRILRAKLPWVRRKLADLAALGPPPEPRSVAPGEVFPYLGADHPLVLVDRPAEPVTLRAGMLEVDRALGAGSRPAVLAWYDARAREYVDAAVARFAPLVGAEPAAVAVRDLGRRRWGIRHPDTRTVTFHRHLVTRAPDLVDYVVVHELTHLHEPGHGPAFWERVGAAMPDWRERRRRLSTQGDGLVL